jgi:DNA-directed RNA polymerase subunit RPC12/RpoP
MIAGSQLRDTQGEMLSIEGADISDLESGRGRLNDNHGKGFFNCIGRITSAKKIFKLEDCEDDRQRYYWEKVKAPFIYVRGYLYDDEDHPNARAAAAILRNIHKTDSPLQLKASVEGGVIARGISDPSLLARTKIHSVALTFTPANNNTLVEPISLDKSSIDEEADMLLIKSVLHLAQTNVPSFRHIVRDASATRVQANLAKIAELMKELGIEGEVSIPSKHKIIEKALEHKIKNNLVKIRDGVKLLKEEQMEKGVKEAVASALTAAAIAGAPQKISEPKQPTPIVAAKPSQAQTKTENKPKVSHEDVFKQVASKHPLLGAIGQVESDGGKNLKHKTVTDKNSIHYGHTAGGIFGMMPHAAAFIIKKDKKLAEKYPELAEAAKDINSNHKKFTDRFNEDPQAAVDFALSMFNRNKNKTISNHQLVYSWLNGLKGSWNALNNHGHDALENHEYVKRVMNSYSKMLPQRSITSQKPTDSLNKALIAGYGGAAAPSSRVGGSVLQTESLEDGRSGFKYLTCDNCGKEQIYAKYQVKCRHCGHNFSFKKLESIIAKKG